MAAKIEEEAEEEEEKGKPGESFGVAFPRLR
jgi:hypothetical protein